MAFQCFVDKFFLGAGGVGTTVVRTGYGFQPKACLYWWTGRPTAGPAFGALSLQPGFGIATSPTNRACITSYSQDAAPTMITNRRHDNANVIACTTFTTVDALEGSADLQSFDAGTGGQTLDITDQFPSDIRVHCLALGGGDLMQATVVAFQSPGTTGIAEVTVGFQPTALLLLGTSDTVVAPSIVASAMLSLGVTVGGSPQGVAAFMDTDAGGNSVASRYGYGGQCLVDYASYLVLRNRAVFESFTSTGFRLDWTNATANYRFYALALRGGSAVVGNFLTSTTLNATIVESGLGFQPRGALLLSSSAAQNVANTPTTQANLSLGAFSSTTNRAAQSIVSNHGAATAACASSVNEDACLRMLNSATTSAGVVDVSAIGSDSFTLIMDAADVTTTKYATYLAFGDTPPPEAGARTPPTVPTLGESSYLATAATTRVTGSMSVQAGDVLVAVVFCDTASAIGTLAISGGSLAWTTRRDVGTSTQARMLLATAVVDVNKSMTVTATRSLGTSTAWGVAALVVRGVSGLGVDMGQAVSATGVPSFDLTTLASDSMIVFGSVDQNGVAPVPTWLTNAGAFADLSMDSATSAYSIYLGRHTDAGAPGTYTVGQSAPTGQLWAAVALELYGPLAPTSPPIAGTFTATQDDQTLAATGGVTPIIATLSQSQDSQTLSSASALAIAGTLSQTQASQTVTAAAALALTATLSQSQASQTLSSVGGTPGVTATLTSVQAAQTLSATGSAPPLSGTLTLTQSAQTLSANGSFVPISGIASLAQTAQALSASGGAALISGTASLAQTAQTLSAVGGTVPSSGTLTFTQGAQTLSGTGALALLGTAVITQGAQTLSATSVSPLNVGVLFATAEAPWTIAATLHGATHANLRVQTYDNATPRRRLRSGPISVHPSSFLVTIPWLQAQSGLAVINSAHPAPGPLANKGIAFVDETELHILDTVHGFATPYLLIDVYDNATPRQLLPDADVTVHPTTFEVIVKFLQAQSGLVVICAAGNIGTSNSGTTFVGQTSVTLPGTTFPWRGVQVYDTAGVEVLPGRVTLAQAATYATVVEFLQAQSGMVVLNESGAAAGTAQGSASLTQAAQTLSSAGALALKATLSMTQGAQAMSSAGVLALKATLGVTQDAQALSSTGAVALKATLAATQGAQTLSSTGIRTALSGTLAAVAASDGLTSTGALAVKATLAAAQAAQTLSSTGGSPALSGTLTAVAGADGLSSTGALALKATLSQAQASQALVATGIRTPLSGTLTATAAPDGLSSTGKLALQATLGTTQNAQTLSSTGVHPAISGTLTTVAGADGLSSAGKLALQATLSQIQASQALAATGVRTPLSGTLVQAQASQTLSAAGALAVHATASLAQASQTLLALAQAPGTGVLLTTQDAQALTSAAKLALRATAPLAQDAQTLVATGVRTPLSGALTQTQASQTLAATGVRTPLSGTLTQVQSGQTLAASGGSTPLTGVVTLAQGGQTLTASGTTTGSPPVQGSASLAQGGQTLTASGTVTGSLPVQGGAALAQANQGIIASGTLAAALMPELRRFFDHYTRMRRGR